LSDPAADPGPLPSPPATPRAAPSFLDRWFAPVRVAHEAPERLASLAQRGTVVLVMRSPGLLELAFARWFAPRAGLGPLRAVAGYDRFVAKLLGIRRSRPGFAASIRAGGTTVVFLGRERNLAPFMQLLALRADQERPVFLVPALLTWSRRAPRLEGSVWDLLYGAPDAPTPFAHLVGFLRNHQRATFDVGEPVEVGLFADAHAGESSQGQAGRLRARLHLHLAHEFRAAVGPPLKAPSRVRNKVLRDRSLQAAVDRVALETGRPRWKVFSEAEDDLEELASRYRPGLIEVARPILSWAFGRLYAGVEIDEEGLARVRRAAAQAPIVLCPSHKSYVDFLVLSWLLVERGMTPPHIAAGINLSFWPFGPIARAGGAFFIRRKVKGDRIYTAVLRAYVKHLLRDSFPQEFYVEGGRSRTGKLLAPKTGLVSMEVDAWLDGAAPDVLFVPVSIDYERLIEAGSYARELAGGEKKKESLRGLLGIFSVLFRRYERLYVQFEPPISLAGLTRARLGDRAASLEVDDAWSGEAGAPAEPGAPTADGPEAKRRLVQAVANRIAWAIARATTVTPVGLVATALLADVGEPTPGPAIAKRIELLRYLAATDGARFARGLEGAPSDPRQPGPIADALRSLVKEKLVRVTGTVEAPTWQVVPDRRPLVDFHRNAVLHRYIALAIAAAAVRARREPEDAWGAFDRAGWTSRLLKLEFMYQPGTSAEEAFESLVVALERLEAIERAAGTLRPGPSREILDFLAGLLVPFVAGYRLTVEAAIDLLGSPARRPVTRRKLVAAALEKGRKQIERGELPHQEAVSKATVENAVEWLILGQFLRETPEGELRNAVDPQALRAIVDRMNPLLRS
jgi:glycerol-3-phosphate O-acyltransferase